MPEQQYDIFFKGEHLDGHDTAIVKTRLGELFKASPEKLEQLFSGKVVVLQKNLDKPAAARFRKTLESVGAKIYIKTSSTTPAPQSLDTYTKETEKIEPAIEAPSSSDMIKDMPPSAPITQEGTHAPDLSADELNVLPVGSDVLTAQERTEFVATDMDLSHINLASVFTQQLDHAAPLSTPVPDVSHISTAEPGADILAGYESPPPPAMPDTDFMSLAEVGADLETLVQEMAIPVKPQTDHLSVAPVGSDIDSAEKEAPPPAPDVSHIKIAE